MCVAGEANIVDDVICLLSRSEKPSRACLTRREVSGSMSGVIEGIGFEVEFALEPKQSN